MTLTPGKSKIIACGMAIALVVFVSPWVARGADVPASIPGKAPASAPGKAPAIVPAKAPASTPAKAPAIVPAKVPASTPVKAPVSAPTTAPASAPVKAPVSVPASTQAKTPSAESYSYNPTGKPDPFVPFIEIDLLRSKKSEKTLSPSIFPLRNASIDQFKLVGIAGDERRRIAAVEDEKGKVYTLFEGTYIGQNNGRVKSILADRVVVEEKFGTDSGNARINRITMKLHKEDNEGKP